MATMAELDAAGEGKRASAAATIWSKFIEEIYAGILASANYPMHTSVLEGVNNKIKVIKRMAYGFRDSEYFSENQGSLPGKPR